MCRIKHCTVLTIFPVIHQCLNTDVVYWRDDHIEVEPNVLSVRVASVCARRLELIVTSPVFIMLTKVNVVKLR